MDLTKVADLKIEAGGPPAGFTPGVTNLGVFDLPNSEGLNDSERLLSKLCKKSFLSLWSFPNLHTDRDLQAGKGSAKELSDVLAVFGDDVIIFSDKHVVFQGHKDLEVAWPRWYRSAVADSANQLHGAMSWLQRFPDRVFLDAKCTRALPVKLPPSERARFHLVAVTRGSFDACAAHFSGSLGTLQINTGVTAAEHFDHPFTVGNLDRKKKFVHVLDEFSLEVAMRELDTVSDFVEYLRAREEFLTSEHTVVMAAGEEQLVAAYLSNMSGGKHTFLPPAGEEKVPDVVFFDETHYPEFVQSAAYRRRKDANERSYLWDHLIEKFIRLGDPTLAHPDVNQGLTETEQLLRAIASEDRFRRRHLVDTWMTVLRDALPGKRRARMMLSEQYPEIFYIFLVQPRLPEESYEDYRRHRAAMLHAYCRCAKLKAQNATKFIGIGLDHTTRDYRGVSEDLMMYTSPLELSPEDREEAEEMRELLGIFGDGLTVQGFHADEFPPGSVREYFPIKEGGIGDKQKTKSMKRKKKAAQASKKRNRR